MAQEQKSKHRLWKWIAGIFLTIIFVLGIAALYLSAKWKPLLTEKIKDGVYNGSHHLYKIDFKNIHLNLLTGSATIDSVYLFPDTAVFRQLKKNNMAPTHLFEFKMSALKLTRVGILTAYFKKKIDMNAIILDRPSINVIYNKVPKRPDTVKDERTLYEQISKTLKSIHVRNIKIIDADFDYISGATGKTLNAVKHLNVNVKDLLLDSLSQYDTTRFYYTKDISFELTGYKSLSKDKMYTMKVDTITGSAIGKTVKIIGFKMIPTYPEMQFSKINKVQKDRYSLSFEEFKFSGVDFIKLNTEGRLHAQSLKIGPAKVAIFLNRDLPPAGVNKGNNFPHMALKRLPIETIIDTLNLRQIDLAYTEYNPLSQKTGTISFHKLTAKILNVTNDSLQLTKNNHALANVTANLQKVIKINVDLDFNLTAENGAFSYKGTIGGFDMMALNPLSKPLGQVEIESGQVQKVYFNIAANKAGSSGTVHFNYTNLKIKLLKDSEEGEPVKKKGLLSFLANTLLVKDGNPGKDDAPRTANISFQRPPGASFFNLMWKSVFVGIREIVGLGAVPMKSPKQVQEKIKDKKEERKEKREEKREEKSKQNS